MKNHIYLQIPIFCLFIFVLPNSTIAQHDAHRGAVREIARGEYDTAQVQIEKVMQDPSAVWLSLTNAYARAGRTVESEGAEYKRFVIPENYFVMSMLASMKGTAKEAEVKVLVRPKGYSSLKNNVSATSRTSAGSDYTTVVHIDGLHPNTTYNYSLEVDGKIIFVEDAMFKTYPEQGTPGKFSIAFGGGAGYVPEHERIWTTIKKNDPLALLMLGDNVYIDDPEHLVTNCYCYYRRQSRPEWKQLIAGRGVYSIWDDHDFALDDSYGGPEIEQPAWKRPVWEVFTQNWNNPAYGGGNKQPGCWYDFYIGDVHFIMLDCRYYRESSGRKDERVENPSMLGPVQLKWLKKTMKNSQGTFKILVSSVPMSPSIKGAGTRGLDTWDGYTEERDEIHKFLYKNNMSRFGLWT